MKNAMKFFFLLLTLYSYSQTVHHQMISAQGGTTTTDSGIIVKYTVGQQSVTGTKSGSVIIQQGFQQSNWDKIIAADNAVLVTTTTYPNPCIDILNFQFSQTIGDTVFISIYDILGRQVYATTFPVFENKISVNLQGLQSAEYLVQLSNKTFAYHTKIIKTNTR